MQIYLIFFLEGHYFLDIQYIYLKKWIRNPDPTLSLMWIQTRQLK